MTSRQHNDSTTNILNQSPSYSHQHNDVTNITVIKVVYELELRLNLSGKYIEDSLLFALLHAFSKVKVDLSF